MLRAPRYARLVHKTVTTVDGGPHVGRDQFIHTDKVGQPVALDPQRRARLTCTLEGCGSTYDLRVLTAKERFTIVLRRFAVIALVLVVCAFTSQCGQWVYDAGDHSQTLRVLGDVLIGAGVVLELVFLLWLLMSLWFWPPRYELIFVAASDEPSSLVRTSETHPAHTVKLRVRA